MMLEVKIDGTWTALDAAVVPAPGRYTATIRNPPFDKRELDTLQVELRLDAVPARQAVWQSATGLVGERVVVVWLLLEGE
jgi:hypothetical protein